MRQHNNTIKLVDQQWLIERPTGRGLHIKGLIKNIILSIQNKEKEGAIQIPT